KEKSRETVSKHLDDLPGSDVGIFRAEEDLEPRTPLVVGRAPRVEPEHLRAAADARRAVRKSIEVRVQQRPDRLVVEATGELHPGDEAWPHAATVPDSAPCGEVFEAAVARYSTHLTWRAMPKRCPADLAAPSGGCSPEEDKCPGQATEGAQGGHRPDVVPGGPLRFVELPAQPSEIGDAVRVPSRLDRIVERHVDADRDHECDQVQGQRR